MKRILIIEHDRPTAERLRRTLGRAGWNVLVAGNADQVRATVFNGRSVEVVLADIRLPNGDAPELCRELVAGGGPPVILLGDRGHEQALIAGLQLGADDYIVEPIRTGELLARVGVALRRRAAASPPTPRQVGPLTVDPATHTARVGDRRIDLTPREYTVLLALAQHAGEVVSRDEVLARVWGPGWIGTSKVLDVQISSLRRKLAASSAGPDLIRTIRGVGFMVAPPDGDSDRSSEIG